MKKLWVRETLYLLLPVLLVGGGVLLTNRNLLKWRNPFGRGPARVEIVGNRPLALTPFDVSRGYNWGVLIQTESKGEFDVPKSLDLCSVESNTTVEFVYRRGNQWTPVKCHHNTRVSSFNSDGDHPVQVNLSDLPNDAEEVRMRGTANVDYYFCGIPPRGWKPPENFTVNKSRMFLSLKSAPFDIAIKAPGAAVAVPWIPRDPKIKLLAARWFTRNYGGRPTEEFCLHLRHSENKEWGMEAMRRIDNLHFFDGDGKEIRIHYKKGRERERFGKYNGDIMEQFSTKKLASDLMLSPMPDNMAPSKPWSSYKQPIRIQAEISDGTCWPTKIDTAFRHEKATEENLEKFGDPNYE